MDRKEKARKQELKELKQILESYLKIKSDFGSVYNRSVRKTFKNGFREGLRIAVNLMFDKCYQDIGAGHIKLIEKILQDN